MSRFFWLHFIRRRRIRARWPVQPDILSGSSGIRAPEVAA